MAAVIHRFRSKKDQENTLKADELRQGLLDLGEQYNIPEDALGKVLASIDQRTATQSGWTFIMLSPLQNSVVVNYLAENSKRPILAVRLWGLLFTAMRTDTGEICLSRQEIADALKTRVNEISDVMTELQKISAIKRLRQGRGVRYFMNPNVATHIGGKVERTEAQRSFGQMTIFDVIEGGRDAR